MKSHQMKFILRHFQIQKKRNRSNRNRNQTQITFFITIYTSSHVTQIFTIFFFFWGFLSLPALLFLTVCEAQAFVGPLILTTLTFWQWPRRCRISVAVEALSMSPPVPTKSHKMINKTSIPSYITYYKKKLNNMINIKENK